MKKQIIILSLFFIYGVIAQNIKANAYAYNLLSSNTSFTHTCTVGSSNCLWQSNVTANNISGSRLHNTTVWIGDRFGIMTYVAPDGLEKNSSTTLSQVVQPGETALSTLVRVKPATNKIDTYYSHFYVDGQICNNPSDCYWAGAGSFTVVSIIVDSPTPQPTQIPTENTAPPTATLMPTSSEVNPTHQTFNTSTPSLTPKLTSSLTGGRNQESGTSQKSATKTSSDNSPSDGDKTSPTTEPTQQSFSNKLFEIFGIGGSEKSKEKESHDNSQNEENESARVEDARQINPLLQILSGMAFVFIFLLFLAILFGYMYQERYPFLQKIMKKLHTFSKKSRNRFTQIIKSS